jgi:hypothetical protein
MIELFDPARLRTRRDRSLWLAFMGVGLAVVALASWAQLRQDKLQRLQADVQELQQQVSTLKPGQASGASLDSLLRQAEGYEREAAGDGLGNGPASLSGLHTLRASQWLHRLGALAQADVTLHKVAVERNGSVRIEGLARSPDALSQFVQAWERQDEGAAVPTRGIEVKQEPAPAQGLRFWLRAYPLPEPRT